MLAALPASWRAALHCAALQAEWTVFVNGSDWCVRVEEGGLWAAARRTIVSASGVLLPAPPATSAYGPHARLQRALVMPWSPARLWHPR